MGVMGLMGLMGLIVHECLAVLGVTIRRCAGCTRTASYDKTGGYRARPRESRWLLRGRCVRGMIGQCEMG